MTISQRWDPAWSMASRWRRRRVCTLLSNGDAQQAALRDISGGGAWLDVDVAPALGSPVELRHPGAGAIVARVSEICENGIRISFDRQEAAIAFALGAIASDMTRDHLG